MFYDFFCPFSLFISETNIHIDMNIRTQIHISTCFISEYIITKIYSMSFKVENCLDRVKLKDEARTLSPFYITLNFKGKPSRHDIE